jgi:hypothetical protein
MKESVPNPNREELITSAARAAVNILRQALGDDMMLKSHADIVADVRATLEGNVKPMAYGPKQTALKPPPADLVTRLVAMGAIPCGSRELGYAREDSDYDYYLEWRFGLETTLSALGFEPTGPDYIDPQTIGSMRHRTDKVDVILVSDIDLRKDIIAALKRYSGREWLGKIPHGNAYDFWSVLVRIGTREARAKVTQA